MLTITYVVYSTISFLLHWEFRKMRRRVFS